MKVSKQVTCSLDSFAAGVQELLGDIPPSMTNKVGDAVAKSTRKGVKKVKAHASKGGRHAWSGEYIGGFSSHVERGEYTTGEIGNKAKPGLVHLLEKGHATPSGHRTGTFPHMAPAFDEMTGEFVEAVAQAAGEALG